MINLKKIIPRDIRGKIIDMFSFLPDKAYLKFYYFCTTGKKLNLENPVGYNEKLQWLKLNDKHPEYSKLVDKLAVREHVNDILGGENFFPLLGSWKSFDQIDFNSLPNSFVLKCNHDSGSTKIIKDKSSLTDKEIKKLRKFFNWRLKRNYFREGREYPYKGLPRYIMAEQLMVDESAPEKSIEDYKFFCFNGEPKIMLMVSDRSADCRFDFFDMDFNHLDIIRSHPNSSKPIKKPEKFEEMIEIVKKLCKEIKHVRIDLYEINGKIYFGEYTFFPGGGFALFNPPKWEKQLGDFIEIENN